MGSRRLVTVFLAFIPLVSFAASSSVQVKIDTGVLEGTATGPVRAFLGIPSRCGASW